MFWDESQMLAIQESLINTEPGNFKNKLTPSGYNLSQKRENGRG